MLWTQHVWSLAARSIQGGLQRPVVSTCREYFYKIYFFLRNIPIRRGDFRWLALAPAYIMLDTLRHEMSHAFMAWLAGTRVLAIRILPGEQLGYFSFGYTILDENATWLVYAAPYLCDLVLFTATFGLLRYGHFKQRWIYINLILVGLASPLFNSLSGFINSFAITNDVTRLAILFSRTPVTYIFLAGMLYYLALLRRLYRLCIFHNKAQPPFWLAWAQGQKAIRHTRPVW